MNIISQTFSLIKKSGQYADAKEELQKGYDETIEKRGSFMNFNKRDLKKMNRMTENVADTKQALAQSAMAEGLAVASFTYNYAAKTTRFGLRGQDIQDQLKIQDKLVNKAFGIAGVAVATGFNPVAIGVSVLASLASEIVSVSIQNKQYEYNKELDRQQKAILQERMGRAVYNSSRR